MSIGCISYDGLDLTFFDFIKNRRSKYVTNGYNYLDSGARVAQVIVVDGHLTLRTNIHVTEFAPGVSFPVDSVFVVREAEV